MGFMDWVKAKTGNLQAEVSKFKNKEFMEATTAACAMVCVADGVVTPDEKQKMMGFIRMNDALKVFDPTKVIESFEKFIRNFEFDYQIGKGTALQSIAKIKKNPEASRLMIRVCCAIGAADGNFDDDEKQAIREMCVELGLNPEEFGLEPSGSRGGGMDLKK